MMTRARKTAPKSKASLETKGNQFASRPFAQRAEEHEKTVRESQISFSIADIDIFPRETVQPKLRLGPVGDRYEQEADRMARRVVETISSPDYSPVHRIEDVELRRKVAGFAPAAGGESIGPDLESSIHGARGKGFPLSERMRHPMERAFGIDFGSVRLHTDAQADRLNRSIQARAFTTGNDIFLRQGEYRPGSFEGQRLLAHELTHVVQQGQGGEPGTALQRTIEIMYDPGKGEYKTENKMDLQNLFKDYKKGYQLTTEGISKIKEFIESYNNYCFDTIYDILLYVANPKENESSYTKKLGLHPNDMEKAGTPPKSYEVSKGCVVQAIAQVTDKTPQHWHKYFIDKEIDYTESMNHITVFSTVGFELIHNENMKWQEIDPKLMDNKKYILINMFKPGDSGHAFAVTKESTEKYTVKDFPQERIKKYDPNLKIQYVFGE
jgi:hypothetical protein